MTIRLLAAQVADAIAAGEVVERPAAVVKELVENSLDAGARRVTVEIRGAGRNLIRVADDGDGIGAGELRLAFQRHATSKVASLADLASIGTLGFRGEALASIAAVSQLECRSGGARIRLLAGRVLEEGVAMPAPGTTIEVRDLFANTPARDKFLRSAATEAAACVKTVQAYALIYPEVRFEVTLEGRVALRSPGGGGWRAAAAALLGPAVAAELLEVTGGPVAGVVAQPRLSRGTRDGIWLAVNRRPVASRSLQYAVEECYLGLLERGRHPLAVLDLTVGPGDVDVNVHPAKREVRFRAEGEVFGNLQRAIRAALSGSRPVRLGLPASPAGTEAAAFRQPLLHEPAARLEIDPEATGAGVDILRPVGQVLDGYLVAEHETGLVLVDQHAAHERVLYNRILARMRSGSVASQPLLLAEVVELGPAGAGLAGERAGRLRELGFAVEPFGPASIRVLEAPPELSPARVGAAVQELLEVLGTGDGNRAEAAAASLACHAAVRFGDTLEPAEQRRLLTELELTEPSVTCPHGRPTRLVIGWQDLKRHFRRNY